MPMGRDLDRREGAFSTVYRSLDDRSIGRGMPDHFQHRLRDIFALVFASDATAFSQLEAPVKLFNKPSKLVRAEFEPIKNTLIQDRLCVRGRRPNWFRREIPRNGNYILYCRADRQCNWFGHVIPLVPPGKVESFQKRAREFACISHVFYRHPHFSAAGDAVRRSNSRFASAA